MRYVLLTTFVMLFFGCSATGLGTKFSSPVAASADQAALYIYRMPSDLPIAPSLIIVDGHVISLLDRGGYIRYSLSAGKHRVVARWGCIENGPYSEVDITSGLEPATPQDQKWLCTKLEQPFVRELRVRAGQRYFLKQRSHFVTTGYIVGDPNLPYVRVIKNRGKIEPVDELSAIPELKNCRIMIGDHPS